MVINMKSAKECLKIPRIMLAGVSSSVGKTTISSGITASLTANGSNVQTFKCGPDYIDTGYLADASGKPCYNLDSWMMPPENVKSLFTHSAKSAELSIIEGVMGLYDGHLGSFGNGSSAEVAKLTRTPVILVINAAKMAQSAAAIALGFKEIDKEVRIAGVIANNIGSQRHLQIIKQSIEEKCGIPLVGWMPRDESVKLPERHLGLLPTAEKEGRKEFIQNLGAKVSQTVDIEKIIEIAKSAEPLDEGCENILFAKEPEFNVKLAVAYDKAFNFYYAHNLEILKNLGATLCYFSPLKDTSLPEGVSGVYMGGGFPEQFALELSENTAMKEALRNASERGMPIYAECGGLMYLSEGIIDFDGKLFPMAELIKGTAEMQSKLRRLGYIEAQAIRDNVLCEKGGTLRGHMFHWSKLPVPNEEEAAYKITNKNGGFEGFISGKNSNVLATYLHVHFGNNINLARNLLSKCRNYQA